MKRGLEAEFYDVTLAHSGEEGFFQLSSETFDLVIRDLVLPGRDGIEMLTTLRRRGIETPVLILTARDTVEDRVRGLGSGADEYLIKPSAFPELLARIRLLLRRGRGDKLLRLKLADLEMDLVTRRVTRGDLLLELTGREFDLLEYLLRHQGHIVSREMLATVKGDALKEAVEKCGSAAFFRGVDLWFFLPVTFTLHPGRFRLDSEPCKKRYRVVQERE